MTIQFEQASPVETKSKVSLTVKADKGSWVNVLAVDKSLVSFADGNDITPKRVC